MSIPSRFIEHEIKVEDDSSDNCNEVFTVTEYTEPLLIVTLEVSRGLILQKKVCQQKVLKCLFSFLH